LIFHGYIFLIVKKISMIICSVKKNINNLNKIQGSCLDNENQNQTLNFCYFDIHYPKFYTKKKNLKSHLITIFIVSPLLKGLIYKKYRFTMANDISINKIHLLNNTYKILLNQKGFLLTSQRSNGSSTYIDFSLYTQGDKYAFTHV